MIVASPTLARNLVLTLVDGPVVIRLRRDLAPRHVDRICRLAAQHFYDGMTFGRVTANFIAQITAPVASGLPGLPAEFSDVRHVRGTCAMARGVEPDSAKCEFFIFTNDAAFTACQYTVWGEVVAGMEWIDALPVGSPPPSPARVLSLRAGSE